ncbi:MAG TPA: hypothetical protein PKK06_12175 [Phycisphaerae bacterium]|nr:hypothetical protein [Phycisphaerae bacterium]HNU46368.1 hypothetical protein [Phycisphaerae bacterium]
MLARVWLCGPVLAVAIALMVGSGQALAQQGETVAERTDIKVTETKVAPSESKCPATFDLTYTVMSDYIFRGINYSEYPGEGREDLNHQLNVDLGMDLAKLFGHDPGTWGHLGFATWFEWYAGQEKLNPIEGGQNLQEIDYTVYWKYPLRAIETDFTLGWTFYDFANLSTLLKRDPFPGNDKDDTTNEWFVKFEHNDAWLWKWLWPQNDAGVLNPSLAVFHDTGIAAGNAAWIEFGLNHEFPVFDKLTVTPSWTLGVDHNYYREFAGDPDGKTTRLGNMLWGLDVSYDLTELLRIPARWGTMRLSGLLYFSDALGNPENNGIIKDEFFGGVALGYSFGG